MNRLLLVFAAAVLYLLSALGAFFVGTKFERRQFAEYLYETQAAQSFNNLLQFRKVEANLSKGCSTEALEMTKIAMDQEMTLLSQFHKDHSASWVNEYIANRDPNLLSQLASFRSPYGTVWVEPRCAK